MECLQGSRAADNVRAALKEKQIVEVLPMTKLRFSRDQLQALNYHFVEELSPDESNIDSDFPSTEATTIVERLTQRLLSAVGNLDPRFSSAFLITLPDNESKHVKTSLEYLVRLDSLSTPVLYPNDPVPSCEILECDSDFPGFAKIRLRNKTSTNWAEFINTSGYLRRDKIQERFVELLALAAASEWPSTSLDVDESTLCACPSKILDAFAFYQILRMDPKDRLFYGTASNNLRFPDPRDFRLAIVDDPAGIRLRVGFLAPSFSSHDVEVRLLIAIGVDAWSKNTTFPSRVPLWHIDCLLYHEAATMGMYLVSVGQQSTSWQIHFPATEVALLEHHSQASSVARVLRILYSIIDDVHQRVTEDKCKFSFKLLSRRMLRETLWATLEDETMEPLSVMESWTNANISKHVLRLLDKLIGSLRCQMLPGYFFPADNLLECQENAREEDYLVEANRLYMYMARLHSSPSPTPAESYISFRSQEELDSALVSRWLNVVQAQMPPAANRSSRLGNRRRGAVAQYSPQQLDYIGKLIQKMLDVRQRILQFPVGVTEFSTSFITADDSVEDVIYLLVTIIEQARDHILPDIPNVGVGVGVGVVSKSSKTKVKYRTKTRSNFDNAIVKLVEAIRKDRKRDVLHLTNFTDDSVLVKAVLRWLYKALDHSRHSLAPVLRPYLNKLFISSHEMSWSWHLDYLQRSEIVGEINSLRAFARLINKGETSPAASLMKSVNDGCNWATNMLQLVERSNLRIVFCPDRGKVHRHILSLPSYNGIEACSEFKSTVDIREKKLAKNATLPARRIRNTNITLTPINGDTFPRLRRSKLDPENIPTHEELSMSSPLTFLYSLIHRRGQHRCVVDLLEAFAALNKIWVLHELSHILSDDDKHDFLVKVRSLSKQQRRRAVLCRRITLPPVAISKTEPRQLYTPLEESAGIRCDVDQRQKVLMQREIILQEKLAKDSLIGSCRAARIKEDSRVIFHENFKIKALFKVENAV